MTSGRGLPEYRGALSARSELSIPITRLEVMALPGKVVQIDYEAAYARVSLQDTEGKGMVTDWLRWMEDTAGDDREWSPPSLGEIVMVISPSGNLNNGIIDRAINTTTFPPISNSPTIRRKTWGKPPNESFFDYPFWDLEKKKDQTHVWNYLPSKGEFRHEIGDKVLVHWTEDFLMWRIGNTQYIIKDGSAVLTIADDIKNPQESVEIKADLQRVEIHANHEASVTVHRKGDGETQQPAKVEAQVNGKAAIIVQEDSIKGSVGDDASLVLEAGTAVLESKTSKAQLALKNGVSSMCLDGVAVKLTPAMATYGMMGSDVILTPAAIMLNTAQLIIPQNVSVGATPGMGVPYGAGPLAAQPHPPVQEKPQQAKERWPMEESKGPYYPRTGKPKV